MDSRTLAAILPRAPATASGVVTDAMPARSINTPQRQAMFLAQVGHESSDLTRLVESLNYSPTGLRATFPKRITADQALALGRRAGDVSVPEDRQRRIAEAVYGGRADLGNTEDGDGWRFRGRGAIQLTGRANYRRAGEALRLPLEDQPELLGQLPAAVQSAAWFWASNGLNELADQDTEEAFIKLTKRINKAALGLDLRLARWRAARKVLGLA